MEIPATLVPASHVTSSNAARPLCERLNRILKHIQEKVRPPRRRRRTPLHVVVPAEAPENRFPKNRRALRLSSPCKGEVHPQTGSGGGPATSSESAGRRRAPPPPSAAPRPRPRSRGAPPPPRHTL